jgi:pantothenate kinase
MSIELLFEQIQSLLDGQSPRTLIGIVGKPGAGKSTVVEQIQNKYQTHEVSIIPMDGFHLSNKELISLGRRERKGAPDTFDVEGFTSLIKSVKIDHSVDHKFPIFHREIEASIADEGIVPKESKIVVTEGNYLFSEDHNWSAVYPLLDHTWFIEIDDEIRIERLIARHVRYGKSPEEAENWSRGSDETNARFIGLTANRAENRINLA